MKRSRHPAHETQQDLDSDRRKFDARRIRYFFVDIISFAQISTIEAQCEIIYSLNECFRRAAEQCNVSAKDVVYLPTGDGICAAFLQADRFDIHVRFALHVLSGIAAYNQLIEDENREFQIRSALSESVDNLFRDINDRLNVIGDGIIEAQRIMDQADAAKILLSSAAYESLRNREKYRGHFCHYPRVRTKHGKKINVFQLILPDQPGLMITTPKKLEKSKRNEPV